MTHHYTVVKFRGLQTDAERRGPLLMQRGGVNYAAAAKVGGYWVQNQNDFNLQKNCLNSLNSSPDLQAVKIATFFFAFYLKVFKCKFYLLALGYMNDPGTFFIVRVIIWIVGTLNVSSY